jgi:hypothetical protein
MQTPKFNLALSVGTILLAGSTLTACSSNPFSAEKAAEPAKTEAATKEVKAETKTDVKAK